MTDEQQTGALIVRSTHGEFYAIPETELARYRVDAAAQAELETATSDDTSGFVEYVATMLPRYPAYSTKGSGAEAGIRVNRPLQ